MDYSELKRLLQKNAIEPVEGQEYISVNNREGPATYYNAALFNELVSKYVTHKLNEESYLTDTDNILQVRNALNVIYLDADWKWLPNIPFDEYRDRTDDVYEKYIEAWHVSLGNASIKIAYELTYYPHETFEAKAKCAKGGFHHFIFLTRNVPNDERMSLYNTTKSNCKSQFYELLPKFVKQEQNADVYDSTFDIAPIKSMQCLLPFAQKERTSRQYILTDFAPDSPTTFVNASMYLPHVHLANDVAPSKVEATPDKTVLQRVIGAANMDDIQLESLMREVEDSKPTWKGLGLTGTLISQFMLSLRYLSPSHVFWKILRDNDRRLREIVSPYIRFTYVNYYLEHGGNEPNDEARFVAELTNTLLPLLRMTVDFNDKTTKRDTFRSCYDHIKTWYNQYTGIKGEKVALNDKVKNFWHEYSRMTYKERQNLSAENRIKLNSSRKAFQRFFNDWATFVKDIVMAGIKDEIRPFVPMDNNPFRSRDSVTFDEVMPHHTCVGETSEVHETSFYLRTLRTWSCMFIFVQYYDTDGLNEAIRGTLSAFVRKFIWCPNGTGKNSSVYIYNIQQSQSLRAYPYNQWILDRTTDEGGNALEWIKSLYVNIIRSELSTTTKMCGLMNLLDNLSRAGIPIKENYVTNCRPYQNFDADLKKCFSNILGCLALEWNDPPKQLDPVKCPFFPMRNGMLEFLDNGDTLFHYDNYERFMNAYTNVVWDPNYTQSLVTDSDKRTAWEDVNRMWHQIYPIEAECLYVMRLFGSTLHGCIKDQFLILYGTGGDGKTTISNAIQAMLGNEGIANHAQLKENGYTVEVENPCGLATTMKTETILAGAQRQSHDSGGLISINGKRYCTVQEPDQNLSDGKINCAMIKEIQSGTAIVGREIYQRAQSFTPNCLLTLQTNLMLSYTEDTDAVRRRVTVMTHRSKFTTAINADNLNTLEFTHTANPELSMNLTQNPLYWQAMFYSLLPHAQDVLRNRWVPISNIPRPNSVMDTTKQSFASSNGLVGWINAKLEACDGCCINVKTLVDLIFRENQALRNSNEPPIVDARPQRIKSEIRSQICNMFTGKVYILQDKYYAVTTTKYGVKTYKIRMDFEIEDNSDLENEDVETNGMSNDELRDIYFQQYAVNSFVASRDPERADLYILGYRLPLEPNGK